MTWDAMLPELTKMYTETFSEAELKQMAAFYGSPAGQKSLEKLPEMMQRTAMAGARISQPHTDELRASMATRSEELKKEAEGAGGGGPGHPERPVRAGLPNAAAGRRAEAPRRLRRPQSRSRPSRTRAWLCRGERTGGSCPEACR